MVGILKAILASARLEKLLQNLAELFNVLPLPVVTSRIEKVARVKFVPHMQLPRIAF